MKLYPQAKLQQTDSTISAPSVIRLIRSTTPSPHISRRSDTVQPLTQLLSLSRSPSLPNHQKRHVTSSNSSLLPERKRKNNKTIRSKHRQTKRNRLPTRLNHTRNGATAQHSRGKQTQFLAVRLAGAQPREAEHVQCADG